MSTGGDPQNDTSDGIPRNTTPLPCQAERLKAEGNEVAGNKSSKTEGGRLKFFIDGKMVLELSDKQENGKTCWVPVVSKTYWPSPATTCLTPASTVRIGSSTSHSISDESSLQSSPCLRETRWKNPNPRKLLAQKNDESFWLRVRHRKQCRYQWSQRRRPFLLSEQCHIKPKAGCGECTYQWKKKGMTRNRVASVTARLLEQAMKKRVTSSMLDTLVSPRKRLLREMEKVRLNGRTSSLSYLKKAKSASSAKLLPPVGLHSPAKAYDRQSSYSIDSLLNTRERHDEEATAAGTSSFLRTLLGKPGATSPDPAAMNRNRNEQRAQELLLPLTLGMASRLHSSAWLPYVHPSSSFPVPPQPFPLASSLTALALATRPGPSSSSSTYSGRMPTPPDECDDNDVPLNLSTSGAREHS